MYCYWSAVTPVDVRKGLIQLRVKWQETNCFQIHKMVSRYSILQQKYEVLTLTFHSGWRKARYAGYTFRIFLLFAISAWFAFFRDVQAETENYILLNDTWSGIVYTSEDEA